MKRRAIIVDFDGTLYDCRQRRDKYLTPTKKDFEGFHAAAVNDPPNVWCLELVQAKRNAGFHTCFVSGRTEPYRSDAEWWLKRHLLWNPKDYTLHMRADGDYRQDAVIKREIYATRIEPFFDVSFAVDDRKSVTEMWRSMGLVCLQCDEGDF